VLAKIAAVFPVRHFNEAVFAAFDTRRSGAQIAWGHLAVLLAWGAVGLVVALRSFRWEPQRG
jgi:ABC-2 type transport system permease protein